jgi:hypothetical protein
MDYVIGFAIGVVIGMIALCFIQGANNGRRN